MKTFKLIIIALLLLPLMALVSFDTTFAGTEAEGLQNVALVAYILLLVIIARYSNLFKGIITEEDNQA